MASDRRPLVVGATVALALLLAAVAVVAEARDRDARSAASPAALAPTGWKQFRDPSRNLRFSHPADWVVRQHPLSPELLLVIPPDFAEHPLQERLPFVVALQLHPGYYIGGVQAELASGRLRGGRRYVRSTEAAAAVSPPEVQPPVRRWYDIYQIDWGRFCASFPSARQQDCGAHSVTATIAAGTPALLDRFRPAATRIVRALAPLEATRPSSGDRTRPACRPDQWRLVPEYGWSYIPANRSWLIQGTAVSRGTGPACHLRVTLRVSVQRADGTSLPLPGAPAAVTIEGDLPEDTSGIRPSDSLAPPTPLTWHWAWQNWCRQPVGKARVRITAPDGPSATKAVPPLRTYTDMGNDPCGGVRPDAPWRISRWP